MAKSLDGVLIKKAYKKETFTREQLTEFAKCADPANGIKYFMNNYFNIQHPTRGRMTYNAFEYQDKLIDIYHNYRFNINMLPRQTGKSTTAAGYLLCMQCLYQTVLSLLPHTSMQVRRKLCNVFVMHMNYVLIISVLAL